MSYHTIHYLTIHCCQNSKCDKITLLIRTLTSATWRKVCTAFHRHDIAQENAEISEVAQWNFTALHCSCFWNTEFVWCIHTAGWLMFLTMCQYLPTLSNPCAVNVSHYKINSLIKHVRQNQHLTRTYQPLPLHIITYCNQTLQPGKIGVLILNPNGRKEAFHVLFSGRSYCQRAFTLLCSDYTDQSNAAWGCPITSIYYQRVAFMESYFHASPIPWIHGKSSTFYPLQNVHMALTQPASCSRGTEGPLSGIKRSERQSSH